MNVRFDGRVVIVSGAGQNIGRAIATAFLDAGARVHLTDIDMRVVDIGREIGAPAHVADLSDRKAAADLVERVAAVEGRLDVLALAAGGVCGQADIALEDISEAGWQAVMQANLESALWISQAAAAIMTKVGRGRIVIISSGAGLRASLTGLHAYTAAKHAVIGLTKQLSVGLASHGITANSIAPGLILSNPSTRKQWDSYGPVKQREILQSFHTQRLGQPEDIATATLFLASDQAGWITGQILSVDGGRS